MTKKHKSFKQLSSIALVELFADAASTRGMALEDGNPRLANQHFDRMVDVYGEIKSRGAEAQRLFLRLLNHNDPSVRYPAAVRILAFAPQAAEPVLEALAQLDGTIGFCAEMILEQWRKGEFSLL
jgi:Domain of unknown function (DUF2019)